MNEAQAKTLEVILGGEAWQTAAREWVVTISRGDGATVMVTDAGFTEYASDQDLDAGKPAKEIALTTDDDDSGWWVVVDESGEPIYRDPKTESGWRWKEEAEHEAAGLQSRTGERFGVRRIE